MKHHPSTLPETLRYFQVVQLFNQAEVDALLNQPEWASKYPQFSAAWHSPDPLVRSRVELPKDVLLALARQGSLIGDLYGEPDSDTLHMVTKGSKPFRFYQDANRKMIIEEIPGAILLSPEDAIRGYGTDAVWLAQEYGKSQRGECDLRFQTLKSL